MPLGTPVKIVDVPFNVTVAMALPPGVVATYSRYDVGVPLPATHDSDTVFPEITGGFSVGAPGRLGADTMTVTSLLSPLVPPAFRAVTRTK